MEFKGFKQVKFSSFSGLTDEEKKGYMWLVTDYDEDESVKTRAIYFGTRLYAEMNGKDEEIVEKITNIINSLGGAFDEDGNWVGFMPTEDHKILGESEDVTDAIEKLEAYILAMQSSASTETEAIKEDIENIKNDIEQAQADIITNKTDIEGIKTDIEGVKTDIEGVKTDIQGIEDAVSSLNAEIADLEDKKADAENVYTKDETYSKTEIDSKIAGTFKFKGDADEISTDKTQIRVDTDWITASEENVGDVYQIEDKEYASNGSIWVELGFNIDLSEYAKTADVNEKISGATEALEEQIDAIAEDVDSLKSVSTVSAQTYNDAIAMPLEVGQIVYIKEGEEGESGHTAGAYICVSNEGALVSIQKLESSSGTGETPIERINNLEVKVHNIESKIGDTELPEGKTISELIQNFYTEHTVEGDDVEN